MRPSVLLSLPVDPRLKAAIIKAARLERLPMNEWVAKLVADHLECPELADIPRRSLGRHGRPPKQLVPA